MILMISYINTVYSSKIFSLTHEPNKGMNWKYSQTIKTELKPLASLSASNAST
jgi:hypothetical protein